MLQINAAGQICSAAAMGCARDSTSNGERSVTALTVRGQESVIQKYLQKRRKEGQRGKTASTG